MGTLAASLIRHASKGKGEGGREGEREQLFIRTTLNYFVVVRAKLVQEMRQWLQLVLLVDLSKD